MLFPLIEDEDVVEMFAMELQVWSRGVYVISLSPATRRLSAQRRRASSSS
jgi:hypothetical protein